MVRRRQVVKFFLAHGFINKGGARHDRYEHPDGRWTVVERHVEINDRLFENMKKQAGLK
ncbi:MAG: type II toxin-antitoxin system HicA family toxin [Gordonibacter sp.]|uniref:type II toxin-antitoxin system HicA family toxin n=1 Tax=Gordonibacter sp. TaxID=1968902 RepID=UPI002FC70A20